MGNRKTAILLGGILLIVGGAMTVYTFRSSSDPGETFFAQEVGRQATEAALSLKGKVYANSDYQYSETDAVDLTEYGAVLSRLFVSPVRAGPESAPLPVLCSLWFRDTNGTTQQVDVYGYGKGALVFGRRGLASFFYRKAPSYPLAPDKYCDESTTLCNLIAAVAGGDKVSAGRYLKTILIATGGEAGPD